MESLLGIIVVLLVVSVGTVAAARALKLPPLVGYLVVGLLLGPHALALAPDTDVTRWLAEIGVVFLMFSIGLEFSLPKLRAMRSLVFGLGAFRLDSPFWRLWRLSCLPRISTAWAGRLE